MNHDVSLDSTKENNMKLSKTYRTALIAIAGFLLTAALHKGPIAHANSPQGVRNVVIVHGAWAGGTRLSKVNPTVQGKGMPWVSGQNPIALPARRGSATKRSIALQA